MRASLPVLAALLAAVTAPVQAEAQARSLSWPRIEVTAYLDAEGRLHGVERHAMTFTGPWNGGERRFDLRPGQELSDLAMRRLVPRPGGGPPRVVEMSAMRSGAARVDQWHRPDASTVRWRSRMPADPPFDATTLVYELEYTLSGALTYDAGDGTYHLDHEFGFPHRAGAIGTLSVSLDLAPAWGLAASEPAAAGQPLSWSWDGLAPGASPVVHLALKHRGPGRPAAARHPLPPGLRLAPFLAALAAMLLLILGFIAHARRSARFRPLPDLLAPPSRRWLERHLFRSPPEEVGALWDRSVGRPEVAALLARLVAEGKLASRLEPARAEGAGDPVLHLELLVPAADLEPRAADLLAGLLLERRGDVTSTARVKEHYRGKGFSPSRLIAGHLTPALPRLLPPARLHPRWRRRLTPALLAASLVAFAAAAWTDPASASLGAGTVFWATAPAYAIALVVARLWRRSVHWPLGAVAGVVVPPLLALGGTALVLAVALPWLGLPVAGLSLLPMLAGAALLPLAALSSVLYQGRLAETEETVLARRRLRHARDHLAAQLRRPDPDLDDAWLPYLLALGLQTGVADWEERRSVDRYDMTVPPDPTTWSSGAGPGGSGSRGWSGGGGAFGGGGASAAWSSAVSTMAQGVAAPSSSRGGGGGGRGGGGGGGGGGSSGGGGGGGW